MAAVLIAVLSGHAAAQTPAADEGQVFTVFLNARPVGQETVALLERPDGWLVRGSNRLGPPLDVVTRVAEIDYDVEWRPRRLLIEGTSRGQEGTIRSSFANGEATTEVVVAGQSTSETQKVSADALVLPNAFLGSYAALARRLVGQKPGMTFRAYIAPQGEIVMRLDGAFAEQIETPRETIAVTRYALVVPNSSAPDGEMPVALWADAAGRLLRISVPLQKLELAREDIASAAARTTTFSIPGDETVRIPASGFSLAASVSRPPGATGPLPAIVLVPGSTAPDRDGVLSGVPVLGHLAADFVEAGFVVVRYDRRGIGQSGGRAETATLDDYAEDARAVIAWLDRQRSVNKRRIAVVGHGDGAWVAMRAADRDNRVAALVVIAAISTTGAEYTLEQQRQQLAALEATEAERAAKIELQQRINAAALKGAGWDGIPDAVRAAADTPWFQSFLAFDPARILRNLREPMLIVHGTLDTEVAPSHAERLAELARARRRMVDTTLTVVPGVNHLLVPATTGRQDEYRALSGARVAPAVTSAITTWLARVMG